MHTVGPHVCYSSYYYVKLYCCQALRTKPHRYLGYVPYNNETSNLKNIWLSKYETNDKADAR